MSLAARIFFNKFFLFLAMESLLCCIVHKSIFLNVSKAQEEVSQTIRSDMSLVEGKEGYDHAKAFQTIMVFTAAILAMVFFIANFKVGKFSGIYTSSARKSSAGRSVLALLEAGLTYLSVSFIYKIIKKKEAQLLVIKRIQDETYMHYRFQEAYDNNRENTDGVDN
jgi:hypothetical protein